MALKAPEGILPASDSDVHLLCHLGEGEHVGAKQCMLALVSDDPGRHARHDSPVGEG